MSRHAPGRGLTVVPARDGTPVAVINVMGKLYLDIAVGPFEIIDELVDEARAATPVVIVDVHAEATSEKVAMATWLDGRVTAVVGTHTHVQTNDARVLPGGTAAITDAGMTGPHDSVIGVKAELAIQRMRTGLPVRFEPADGGVRLEGLLVTCGADGRATACEPVRRGFSRLGRRYAPERELPHRQHEDGDDREQHEVAREDEPRGRRRVVVDERPVAGRDPDLRQHDARPRSGRDQPAPAGDERDERDQPDQELRREHLAEHDEGADLAAK